MKKIKKIKYNLNNKVERIKSDSQFTSSWYESDERHFSCSFTKMPGRSKYSVENLDKDNLVRLIKQLRILSQMTWAEIKRSGRHQLGTEIIKRDSLNVNLPLNLSDDIKLLAFRYYDTRPFVGYRRGKIFHILYVDHDYTLYNHG